MGKFLIFVFMCQLLIDFHRMMGSIYGNVVRKCLAIGIRERTEAESRELSKFCSEIAASLEKCYA